MDAIGDFIELRRDQIVALCVERARALSSARGLREDELRDALPGFVSGVAELLRTAAWTELDRVIDLHVSSRLRQGVGVEEVVDEICLIGPCVFDAWAATHPGQQPEPRAVASVFEALHHASARSVARLTEHLLKDEQLEKQYFRLLDKVAAECFTQAPRPRPISERMNEILAVIVEAMSADAAWLFRCVGQTDVLELQAWTGKIDAGLFPYSTTVGAQSLAGQTAVREEPLIVTDLDRSALQFSQALRASRIRSVIGVRIWSSRRLLGVLLIGSTAADRFGPRYLWRIEALAGRLALLLDQARMWEELRKQNELVRTSEERLRLAAAAAEVGIWEFDPSSGKLTWDQRSKALWGLPPDAPVSYEVFLSGLHPEDRHRVEQEVSAVLARPTVEKFHQEYRTIGIEDGVERWVSTHGKVVFDDGGRVERFLGVMQDITDTKNLDALRERLLGIVGHDLRNPLSAIKMATSSLIRQVPESQLRMVTIIGRCTDRMNRMIHDLLDFTRVRFAAGIALAREQTNLAVLARDVISEAELANPDRRLSFRVRGDCVGSWDPSRLSEALSNLIGNAIQHGAPATPVEVTVHGEGPEVGFEVHNQGPVIPPEQLSTLFDPFRHRIPSKAKAGLGLGLYITREIVAAHGGEIEVRSDPQSGTTFQVRLPRAPPEHPAAPGEEATQPALH